MKKIITLLLFLSLMPFVMANKGCGGVKKGIEQGFIQSVRVKTYVESFVDFTLEQYRAGKITIQQKDKWLNRFAEVTKYGKQINEKLGQLVAAFPDGNVPTGELSALDLIFNSKVYQPILDTLEDFKLLSPAQNAAFQLAFAGLKLAVFRLKDLFSMVPGPSKENLSYA